MIGAAALGDQMREGKPHRRHAWGFMISQVGRYRFATVYRRAHSPYPMIGPGLTEGVAGPVAACS
jgi:hypothetical protein